MIKKGVFRWNFCDLLSNTCPEISPSSSSWRKDTVAMCVQKYFPRFSLVTSIYNETIWMNCPFTNETTFRRGTVESENHAFIARVMSLNFRWTNNGSALIYASTVLDTFPPPFWYYFIVPRKKSIFLIARSLPVSVSIFHQITRAFLIHPHAMSRLRAKFASRFILSRV